MNEDNKGSKLPENWTFYLLVAFVVTVVAALIVMGFPPWVAAMPGLILVLLYKSWPSKLPPLL